MCGTSPIRCAEQVVTVLAGKNSGKETEMITEIASGQQAEKMNDEEIAAFLREVQVGQIIRVNMSEIPDRPNEVGTFVSPVLRKKPLREISEAPFCGDRIFLSHGVQIRPSVHFQHWVITTGGPIDQRQRYAEWGRIVRVSIQTEAQENDKSLKALITHLRPRIATDPWRAS